MIHSIIGNVGVVGSLIIIWAGLIVLKGIIIDPIVGMMERQSYQIAKYSPWKRPFTAGLLLIFAVLSIPHVASVKFVRSFTHKEYTGKYSQ